MDDAIRELYDALQEAVQKLQTSPPKSELTWRYSIFEPKMDFAVWLRSIMEQLQSGAISCFALEELDAPFGGYGAWTWEYGSDTISPRIAAGAKVVLSSEVTKKGKDILIAAVAEGLFNNGEAELTVLLTAAQRLRIDSRDANTILWRLNNKTDPWVEARYEVTKEKHEDPREDIELWGYFLTPAGRAATNSA